MSASRSVVPFLLLLAAVLVGCPDGPSNGDGGPDSGPDGGEPDAGDGGDADADADSVIECDARPTGLRGAAVTHGGCAWLDGDLVELTIDRWCTLDTERDCRLTCDPAEEPRGVSTCLIEAGAADHVPEGELCVMVVAALEITVDGWLDIVGTRPAAIFSAGRVTIDGMVAADGHGQQPGPGGHLGGYQNTGGAGPGSGSPGDSYEGSGGGGYGGAGGRGGSEEHGGAGGEVYGDCAATVLLGGSGGATSSDEEAAGGGGGGGVHIFAAARLEVGAYGSVSASGGAGGDGHSTSSGGGGGGSGGTVLVEAPVVSISGTVRANGGHGGEDYNGRNGGAGGSGDQVDGRDGVYVSGHGGGGGGGGAGRVFVRTAAGARDGDGPVSPVLQECLEIQLPCE